jgi:hypothetical protein
MTSVKSIVSREFGSQIRTWTAAGNKPGNRQKNMHNTLMAASLISYTWNFEYASNPPSVVSLHIVKVTICKMIKWGSALMIFLAFLAICFARGMAGFHKSGVS